MDDFDLDDYEGLLRGFRTQSERSRSLDSCYEDIQDRAEELEGEWGEWMCPECGIFMRAARHRCVRCRSERL